MANRVLLGSKGGQQGLYISKPGVDVLTASPDQLLFDTRLGHYGSVIAFGTATAGSVINFPTMPYIPMAFVMLTNGTTLLGSKSYVRTKTAGELPAGTSGGSQSLRNPSYSITTSTLTINNPTWYNDVSAQNYTVRYVVWRMPGS
jgi:hypothetical protein